MSEIHTLMEARLARLQPSLLSIQDDSEQHAGHAGASPDSGHYTLHITSTQFSGLSRVARHRLIYDALGDLMQNRIHALAIEALTPDES